jgi:hypothetical protein
MAKPKWKEIRPGLWTRPIDPKIQKLMPSSKPPNKACTRLKLLVGKIIRFCTTRFSG